MNPFLFLRLCYWKVLKILGHCLADLSWNGAYAGATVHRYFGLLRRKKTPFVRTSNPCGRKKKTSPLHYNRICYSFLLPKKCVWPNNIIVMHKLKYPTDEQLRLLDISSNNNLPSVLFELESIFIFFRGTLRLFFVKYLFGEEKHILRRIFYSLRTAKNF